MRKTAVFLLCLVPLLVFAIENTLIENENFIIESLETPDFVTTFQSSFLENSSQVILELSDGSRWMIRSQTPKKTIREISQTWKEGDDIRIMQTPKDSSFVLKNLRNQTFYSADLDCNSSDAPLYYIDKIDKHGYVVLTNDGSQWVTGWLGAVKTQHWQTGESLTINKSDFSRKEDYLIINRGTGASCWTSLISWK